MRLPLMFPRQRFSFVCHFDHRFLSCHFDREQRAEKSPRRSVILQPTLSFPVRLSIRAIFPSALIVTVIGFTGSGIL